MQKIFGYLLKSISLRHKLAMWLIQLAVSSASQTKARTKASTTHDTEKHFCNRHMVAA